MLYIPQCLIEEYFYKKWTLLKKKNNNKAHKFFWNGGRLNLHPLALTYLIS